MVPETGGNFAAPTGFATDHKQFSDGYATLSHVTNRSVWWWRHCCSWRSASRSHRRHFTWTSHLLISRHFTWTSHLLIGGVQKPLIACRVAALVGIRSRVSLQMKRWPDTTRLPTVGAVTTVAAVSLWSSTVDLGVGALDPMSASGSKSGNWARKATGRSATTSPRRSTSRSNAELLRRRWRVPLVSVVSSCFTSSPFSTLTRGLSTH